jgi:hypothetical protein
MSQAPFETILFLKSQQLLKAGTSFLIRLSGRIRIRKFFIEVSSNFQFHFLPQKGNKNNVETMSETQRKH